MYIPWGPLAVLAVALVVALIYRRSMPAEHQNVSSPIFWTFVLVGTFVFGAFALMLAQPH